MRGQQQGQYPLPAQGRSLLETKKMRTWAGTGFTSKGYVKVLVDGQATRSDDEDHHHTRKRDAQS